MQFPWVGEGIWRCAMWTHTRRLSRPVQHKPPAEVTDVQTVRQPNSLFGVRLVPWRKRRRRSGSVEPVSSGIGAHRHELEGKPGRAWKQAGSGEAQGWVG